MAHLLRRQDVRAEPFDATKVRSSAGRRSVFRANFRHAIEGRVVPCTTSTLATPSAWKGRAAPSSERLGSARSEPSRTTGLSEEGVPQASRLVLGAVTV